jgi:hypothetical protein
MEIKNTITGGLLQDVAASHIPKGNYVDARNVVVSDPTSGDYSRVEKIVGSKNVTYSLGYTITKFLGSCSDDKNGIMYYFCEASTGNKIISVELDDTVSTVMDYDFGWLSTTKINNAFFLQDSIIWIDNSDEIKRLPIGLYPVTPTAGSLDGAEISLMKKAPLQPAYTLGRNTREDADNDLDPIVRDADYQFAYYFEYFDGGKSVISPISKVFARKNFEWESVSSGREYNDVRIYANINTADVDGGSTMQSGLSRDGGIEDIPKSVKRIVFCGSRVRSSAWFEVGDVSRVPDASYDLGFGKFSSDYILFNGTLTGVPIPSVQLSTQYFVPKDPKAIAIAGNRVLAANFNEGNPKPIVTAILNPRAEVNDNNIYPTEKETRSDIIKMNYYSIIWNATNQTYDKSDQATPKYVYFDEQNGYYDTDYNPGTYSKGDTVTVGAALDMSGTGAQNQTPTAYFRWIEDVESREVDVKLDLTSLDWTAESNGWMELGAANGLTTRSMTFSGNSTYEVGVIYCDAFGRKSDLAAIGQVTFTKEDIVAGGISYEINIDELDKPSWASSIEVVLTKNTEKELLISGRSGHTAYSKNDADGTEFKSGTYALPNFGLAISIEGLIRQGFGYSWEEEDRVRLFRLERGDTDVVTNEIIDEPITGQDGNYIYISGNDYTQASIVNPWEDYQIEIYRKRKGDADSVFYGNAQTHILSSGRNTIKGILSGDLFTDFRLKYEPFDTGTEASVVSATIVSDGGPLAWFPAMTLDDDGAWVQPVGKAFIEATFGTVYKENYVRFGGQIINDTKINGLGEFLALDEVNTDVEFGEINKLQLVGDDQGQGTVVLAMAPLRISSLYIGSSVLSNADGTTSMIKSEDFIGMVRPQSKEYGTIHPESVISVKGKVFFYDNINSCFVMYASNGLHEISSNGLDQFFREKPLKTSEVICGYYDTYEMLLVTVKDGYNSFNDTIGYDTNNKKWRSFYDVIPDTYARMNDVMYISKDGLIGKCRKVAADDTLYSNWFGVQNDSYISIPFSDDPSMKKLWKVLRLEVKPDAIQWNNGIQELIDQTFMMEFSNEDGQFADIIDGEFEIENNTIYATIGLDQNSPGGITDGEELMSKELVVKILAGSGGNIQIGELGANFDPVNGQSLP